MGIQLFHVYVIKSQTNKIYTGHTGDLERRLLEHNSGLCKSTKIDKDWKLIHSEVFDSRGKAMKRERWLKTGVGREFIKGVMKGVESAPYPGRPSKREYQEATNVRQVKRLL